MLFEGYTLYPYRANDTKNRVRWQFGVLAPPGFVELDASERSWLRTDCLLEGRDLQLSVRVRFLHVQLRRVERATADGFAVTDCLDVGEVSYLPCDEAIVHEQDVAFTVPAGGSFADSAPLQVPGGADVETLVAPGGETAGRLVRSRVPLQAVLRAQVEPLPGPYGVRRLRLELENHTPWTSPRSGEADRPDALRSALVAAHLLVSVDRGAFVSMIDPPQWAKGYAAECEQVGTFPVLAGPPGTNRLVLASPIILYDHPQVAPESPVQFCDGLEIDELLTLRTMTLTEQEKRQVRGSDPRAAELIDHIDHLPPELLDRLHGAIRGMSAPARPVAPEQVLPPWWDADQDASVDPDHDVAMVRGVPVGRGAAVILRPGARRADAQDMFLEGRRATVAAVIFDVDGGTHLAVSLDDLAEDGYNPHGRYLYFGPDEVEPVPVSS